MGAPVAATYRCLCPQSFRESPKEDWEQHPPVGPCQFLLQVTGNWLNKLSVDVLYLFWMSYIGHCIHWTSTIRDLKDTERGRAPVVLDFVPAPYGVVSKVYQLV